MKKKLLILGCCLVAFTCSYAATVTWDGGAGTTTWSDALNWDTDAVPTSSDDVDLDGSTVILTANTTVLRIYAGGSSNLTINAGVTLTINNNALAADGNGALEVQGSATVTNNGTILIANTAGTNRGHGYYNKGTSINNGTITIDDVNTHGLYVVAGTFTNSSTGSITITDVGQTDSDADNIYVDDANSGTLFGNLINHGSIQITMTTGDDGIYVNDNTTFNNENGSTITITGATGDNGIRVDDGGVFNNNSGGTLTINATPDDQLFLDNDGAFNNTGIVNLNNSSDVGLYITDAGVFTNNATGAVNISSATNFSMQVDANGSTAEIVNSGTITVTGGNNDGLRLQELGKMTNNAGGTINFNTCGDEGIQVDADNATVVSTLTNNGIINITDAADHGMEVFGAVNNGGTITLTNGSDLGLHVASSSGGTQATFTNTSTGNVTINNPVDHSIQIDGNSSASPATINNAGTISITDGGGIGSTDGIRIKEAGIMTINTGGIVNITDAEDEGIELDNPSTLTNNGTITITNSADHGMEVDGIFNNMNGATYTGVNCGDDGIRVITGTVNNDGAIRIDGSGSEDIQVESTGTFTNTSNATFAPGSSPGDLEIRENFDLGTSSTTFEISGTTPTTDFDQILNTVTANSITISNATMILDWGSYIPNIGDKFKVIDGSGSVNGTFTTITNSNTNIVYMINYTATEVEVEVMNVVPVELTYFIGEKSEKGVQLSWETASEEINEGFDVERSSNGEQWEQIGFVQGNGNSVETIQYNFLDEMPLTGTNYYRLKQNDFDGNFEYSDVIFINFNNGIRDLKIYPNPVQDILFFDKNQTIELLEVRLYDANGQLLWMKKGVIEQISFEDYPSGIYFLNILDESNWTIQKIIHY